MPEEVGVAQADVVESAGVAAGVEGDGGSLDVGAESPDAAIIASLDGQLGTADTHTMLVDFAQNSTSENGLVVDADGYGTSSATAIEIPDDYAPPAPDGLVISDASGSPDVSSTSDASGVAVDGDAAARPAAEATTTQPAEASAPAAVDKAAEVAKAPEAPKTATSAEKLAEINAKLGKGEGLTADEGQALARLSKEKQEYDTLQARDDRGDILKPDEQKRLEELRKEGYADSEADEAEAEKKTPDEELDAALKDFDPTDPKTSAKFLERVQQITNGALSEGMKKQVAENVGAAAKAYMEKAASGEGMTPAEKDAFENVQKLLGEMRSDLYDIMNAKKTIETLFDQQEALIRNIKTQESRVPKSIDKDDAKGQKMAFDLINMYDRLKLHNSRINIAIRQADVANDRLRYNKAEVARALGVDGFWTGLSKMYMTRIGNMGRRASRNAKSALRARPLATKRTG